MRILFQNSSPIFIFRRPSVVRGQAWHPTLSPLYYLLDHTNQIFSESLWHPLSADPPTTCPLHFLTHQAHPKLDLSSSYPIYCVLIYMSKYAFRMTRPDNFSFFWTSLSPLQLTDVMCITDKGTRQGQKIAQLIKFSEVHPSSSSLACWQLVWLEVVVSSREPQEGVTAGSWTGGMSLSNLYSTSCSMGDELVPSGMTFHLPNSDVLEQKIYRIVTRKSENSQLELKLFVLSSVRHGILWTSAQVLCLVVGSETD